MKRKILSVILSLSLVLSMIPAMSVTAFAAGDPEPNYLTFTATEDNSSVQLTKAGSPNDVTLEYKYNDDEWKNYTIGDKINLGQGDKVLFKGNNTNGFATNKKNYYFFVMEGLIKASGSVTSLTDGNGGDPNVKLSDYCYFSMFKNCISLESAPELPATTLAKYCYLEMFQDCSKLTSAPELPATKLADNCYNSMFKNCTSLTSAPELPASILEDSCYKAMFQGCTKLTSAPELPATTLANNCYNSMFRECSIINISDSYNTQNYQFKWITVPDDTSGLTDWSKAIIYNTAGFGGPLTDGKTYYQTAATVYFDSMGGSRVENAIVTADTKKITKPADPVKPGSKFVCWCSDKECTKEWDFEKDTVTKNTKLYAKWEDYKYSASNNVITATADGTKVSLKLTAKNLPYTGKEYKGAALYSKEWIDANLALPTIMYKGRQGTFYAASETGPTKVGKYTAYVVVDGKYVAQANFQIMTKKAYQMQIKQKIAVKNVIKTNLLIKKNINILVKHFLHTL